MSWLLQGDKHEGHPTLVSKMAVMDRTFVNLALFGAQPSQAK